MKMIDEALRYAKAGIPVFPLHWLKQDGTCSCRLGDMCQAKGKHPRIKNWSDEATTDVAKITGWWNQTPLANIGIPMGEKSGLMALDVDTRHVEIRASRIWSQSTVHCRRRSRQRPVVAVNTTFSNTQKNWHSKMWLDSVTALMYAHKVD